MDTTEQMTEAQNTEAPELEILDLEAEEEAQMQEPEILDLEAGAEVQEPQMQEPEPEILDLEAEAREQEARIPEPETLETEAPESKKTKRKKKRGLLAWLIHSAALLLLTAAVLAVVGAYMVLRVIFMGPYETSRKELTIRLCQSERTRWVPEFFLGEELVRSICTDVPQLLATEEGQAEPSVVLQRETVLVGEDEWQDCPEGLRIETVHGETYNAYAMIIRDPSRVYVATSSEVMGLTIPGKKITDQMKAENAVAGINGGAFWDDGTASPNVGNLPCGIVYSKGKCLHDDGSSYNGFAGLTEDNELIVANWMSRNDAEKKKIRDGCCFGPVLIVDGEINEKAYNNTNAGYNPRTCIAQREDGAVIFLCTDGRYAGSLGASYADCIDILLELGAVNAMNLDGGASSVMMYRDEEGRYGEAGELQMINQYPVLQANPRKMPTYFMVKPLEEVR